MILQKPQCRARSKSMRGRFCRFINRRKKLLTFLQLLIWPAVIAFVAGGAGVRLNLTASVPVGLYWVSSGPESHFLEFCPPEPFGSLSVERAYRTRSTACPDGGEPLLKPVVAREGDFVEVSSKGISVNGSLIPNTGAKSHDTTGRPLSPWPLGFYLVTPGTVWVASSYNSRSFDSRYFGPICSSEIRHVLRPLLTGR